MSDFFFWSFKHDYVSFLKIWFGELFCSYLRIYQVSTWNVTVPLLTKSNIKIVFTFLFIPPTPTKKNLTLDGYLEE